MVGVTGVDISGQPLPLKDLLDAIKADARSAAFLGKILDARLMMMIKAAPQHKLAAVVYNRLVAIRRWQRHCGHCFFSQV